MVDAFKHQQTNKNRSLRDFEVRSSSPTLREKSVDIYENSALMASSVTLMNLQFLWCLTGVRASSRLCDNKPGPTFVRNAEQNRFPSVPVESLFAIPFTAKSF